MRSYIEGFIQQLEHGFEIGTLAKLTPCSEEIRNVLICGLGGSGIGGTIIAKTALINAKIPFATCNDYHIPEYVNQHTLVIACSYSGNTEETLSAIEKAQAKGANFACVTSGGELEDICKSNGYSYIKIPGGNPPRTCIGYSIISQAIILNKFGIFDDEILNDLQEAINLLKKEDASIRLEAENVAKNLAGKLPVIYSTDKFEPVSIRFRQQLNENSKMLCWHHKFPELNHNEIVGWASGNENLSVVILRNEDDYYRTKERIEFTKKVILEKGATLTEIHSKGNSFLEKAFYLIYLTDWVSFFIAEIDNTDPIEIRVIDALKDHLATVN